jgi:ElaB/YqjD/DUF883 family membrane-anchored ribosome-binding protein
MADEQEPEVIRHQMEAQRASLDEKLDKLETRILKTVDGAREAVAETIDTVKDTVQTSLVTVKETFDVKRQVERHPWHMFGGAVAVGFAVGWLANRASNGARAPALWSRHGPVGYTGEPSRLHAEPRSTANFGGFPPGGPRPDTATAPAPVRTRSWIDELSQTFAPEIQKAKGLAIGAALGLVRDMVNQAVPDQLRPQVAEVMDGITTKLGGEPLQGDLLQSLRQNDEHANGHHRSRAEEVPA